jgi:hypothetical protein
MCHHLLAIYNTRQALENAVRNYEQISKPFETVKPRVVKPHPAPPAGEISQTQGWINVIKGIGAD